MQYPVQSGGVVAPKPPHSLNSCAVLPPEPPVLVSESHSGHCTDFLKVSPFLCSHCQSSDSHNFLPGQGNESQQAATATCRISGTCCCERSAEVIPLMRIFFCTQSRFSPSVIVYPAEDPNSGLSVSPPKPVNSRQAFTLSQPL
jgi:hypothetical protein